MSPSVLLAILAVVIGVGAFVQELRRIDSGAASMWAADERFAIRRVLVQVGKDPRVLAGACLLLGLAAILAHRLTPEEVASVGDSKIALPPSHADSVRGGGSASERERPREGRT